MRLRWIKDEGKEVGVTDLDVLDAERVKDVEPANERLEGEEIVVFDDKSLQCLEQFRLRERGLSSSMVIVMIPSAYWSRASMRRDESALTRRQSVEARRPTIILSGATFTSSFPAVVSPIRTAPTLCLEVVGSVSATILFFSSGT